MSLPFRTVVFCETKDMGMIFFKIKNLEACYACIYSCTRAYTFICITEKERNKSSLAWGSEAHRHSKKKGQDSTTLRLTYYIKRGPTFFFFFKKSLCVDSLGNYFSTSLKLLETSGCHTFPRKIVIWRRDRCVS